jgi:hypothetical protein
MDFVNIDKNLPNGENMGGLAQYVIFGLWADVLTWPAAPPSSGSIEDFGAWVGDLVMKAGKRAFTFYCTDETAELKFVPVGEKDGKSFRAELTIYNPGLKKKILGFMAAAKNENLFFIPTDQEGQRYLLGDSLRAAKFESGDVGTGRAIGDRKGASLTFTFPTNTPRVYVGDVTTLLGESSG